MKTFRMLFGLFVLAATIYLSWKVMPVYFANYQFEEDMDDAARNAAADFSKTPDDIRASILEKAQSREIPLGSDDISVVRNGSDVSIAADYVVRIDVPIYPFDLSFHPSTNREGLRFK